MHVRSVSLLCFLGSAAVLGVGYLSLRSEDGGSAGREGVGRSHDPHVTIATDERDVASPPGQPDVASDQAPGGAVSTGPSGGTGAVRDYADDVKSMAMAWSSVVLESGDYGSKEAALQEILNALRSGGRDRVQAALLALCRIGSAEFDRDRFRSLVSDQLESSDSLARAAALGAIVVVGMEQDRIPRVVALAGDESSVVRRAVPLALRSCSGGRLDGEMEAPFILLLGDSERSVRSSALRALSGSVVSDAIADELVVQSTRSDPKHEVLYFGLSTLREKPATVTDALLKAMTEPDSTVSSRAAWGLLTGVSPADQRRVADAALELAESTRASQLRAHYIRLVGVYGDIAHVGRLRVLSQDVSSGGVGLCAGEAIRSIESR